jgi:hypothetical protein
VTSLNDVITSKCLLIWKALIKGFYMRYYTVWFLRIQNLTLVCTIFDKSTNHEGQGRSALKTNQLSGRACATFTPSLKLIRIWIIRKIRFLSVLWLGQILIFTFDLDPYHLVWWLETARNSYILTMMILRWKTKQFEFLRKNKFLRYTVTKWRYNVKIFVDLESTH